MRSRKSLDTVTVSSSMYQALFSDCTRVLGLRLDKDLSRLLSRIESEGETFLFITLPQIGKAVEASYVSLEPLVVPAGFKKLKGSFIPLFLNGVFKILFDQSNGLPIYDWKSTPNRRASYAYWFLRQVCMLYSKVEGVVDNKTVLESITAFKERISTPYTSPDVSHNATIKAARRLIRRVFEDSAVAQEYAELKAFEKEPWGRHGPGAVAGREKGARKWEFQKWPGIPARLFSWNHDGDIPVRVVEKQPCARLVAVPKDFRGPRLICIEPKENQFAQQGLMDILYRTLCKSPISRRSIHFWDVNRNKEFCKKNTYSTIDLKDASDWVKLPLLKLLLPKRLYRLFTRYRTRGVDDVLHHSTAFTMGNAICFPIETLVFWALSKAYIDGVSAWWRRRGTFLERSVLVFGDDIIVPVWGADGVTELLSACGFRTNMSKTCIFSCIRESCGEYLMLGEDVSIIRPKEPIVDSYRSWIAWVDLYWKSRDSSLRDSIGALLNGFVDTALLRKRFNRGLQRSDIRVPVLSSRGRKGELSNYQGLYAWKVGNDTMPCSNGDRKTVKWKWVLNDGRYEIFSNQLS